MALKTVKMKIILIIIIITKINNINNNNNNNNNNNDNNSNNNNFPETRKYRVDVEPGTVLSPGERDPL